MDIIFDKNLNLIIFASIVSYIYIYRPKILGKYNKIFGSYTFIFISISLLYFRVSLNIQTSLIVSLLFIFLLMIIKNHGLECDENFSQIDPFKITLNNGDIIILDEGEYDLDGENSIPEKILDNINKIISFEVDKQYYVIITNKNSKQVYRGKKFIQSYNIFDNIMKIEIIRNN